jgi:hypothetical protein
MLFVGSLSRIRHSALASRKQPRTLSMGIALIGKDACECFYRSESIWFAARAGTQVEAFERRSRGMARETSKRGGHLTPEQAREGHRWIRLTVLAAVLQAWMMVAVVALVVPRLLFVSLVLGAVYSLAAPLLLRYLNRDIERRVIPGGAVAALVTMNLTREEPWR